MKRLVLAALLCSVSVPLSGCLATAATIGASLATGIAAGCDSAARTPGANGERVSAVCGGATN
jgi:hypothetical protein